ncbi:hypothetical protein [Thermovibrio sp.]
MKKRLLILAILFLSSCGYTMAISESRLNANIRKSFPVERDYKVAKVELFNPSVKLLGNGFAEVKFNYKLQFPFFKPKTGEVKAKAKVVYDPKTATVYLTDVVPLNGPSKERELLREALRALGKIPVYRIEGAKAKLVKGIEVKKGELLVKLGV